jgi:TonB family protein
MKRGPKLSFAQGQLLLWILAGSLVAFGAMFVFFRVSGVSLATAPRETSRVLVMPKANQNPFSSSDPRYVIADVFDPSLMTLPSAHGFSRGMWRQKIVPTQRNLGWNEQPAFLADRPMDALRSLLEPTPVDAAVLSAAEKTPALSEESNDNEAIEPPISINQSVLRVLSALEDRGVTYLPPLPVITSSGPIRPTQVRVGVGADGLVLYAVLDRSCGDEAVDAQALALVQQIRFEAERDSSSTSVTWGVLRFLWATQGATSTNGESTVAQH